MRHHFLVMVASLLVAGSFLASEKLAELTNPFSLTLLRFCCAWLVLLPFILAAGAWRKLILTTMPRAMIISFFYAMFFVCFFASLHTTTTINTGTLFTLLPLTTAILCWIIFRERMTAYQWVVYLLGALGTCWVIFNARIDLLLSFSLNRGDLIFLIGMVSMAGYTICAKWLYRNDPMIVLLFCTLVGGSFWMLSVMLMFNMPMQWDRFQGRSILYMAYLVIGATIATVYIYQRTIVVLGPNRVNAYIYLNPVLVAVVLFVMEGKTIPAAIVPGILISAAATLILQKMSTVKEKN